MAKSPQRVLKRNRSISASNVGGRLVVQSLVRGLVNKSQYAPHKVASGVGLFLKLNLDHISRSLKLVELGAERGEAEEPAKEHVGFDDVEDRILNYVRQCQAEAHATYEDQLQAYNQRLAKLGFHSVTSEIQNAAKTSAAAIEAEVQKSRDIVGELKAAIAAAHDEWTRFRAEHDLRRAATYPVGPGAWALRWGIIACIVLVEAAMNGVFFSQGSDLGLMGGVSQAVLIALMNVGVGLCAGFFPARWVTHRSTAQRGLGWALLLCWSALAACLNLAVGHYRNAMEALQADPAAAALATFQSAPFGLHSLEGWALFLLGLFFSGVALVDGRSMDDAYPGYGAVDRRLEMAKDRYVAERADLLDVVREEYEQGVAAITDKASQLGKRRDEGEMIRSGIESLRHGYMAHLRYLEEAANGLLEIYRDANRKARPARTTPTSFRTRWKHDFPAPSDGPGPAYTDASIQDLIRKAQTLRAQGERKLEKARGSATTAFPELSVA